MDHIKMEETSFDHHEGEGNKGSVPVLPSEEDGNNNNNKDNVEMATPDVSNVAMKLERAESMYRGMEGIPTKAEVWVWYLYELCSYFIHNTLIPVLFPLIISQVLKLPPEPASGWGFSHKGLSCSPKEMKLYESITHRSIAINTAKFSPLEWTSFSWGIGLFLAAPVLGFISIHLDHGSNQRLITSASIAIGALFCLPAGFFNVTWIFPPYIAAIVVASIIAAASHTRQFGLMLRGFTGLTIKKSQFSTRRGVSGWLSLYATAAGGLGSAIISTFIYHMLKHGEKLISLWIVAIFSGLKWLGGLSHVIFIKPGTPYPSSTSSIPHFFSIFNHPHAFGTLLLAFISSFTVMCIFTSGVLYLIGELCFKPLFILICWLTYFLFPIISLPIMHPLQRGVKANAMKMHLLGFYLSVATSVVGFIFRDKIWHRGHVLVLAAVQSTSVGLLHSYGRILLIDCSPKGKEGAFSAWFSWSRNLGSCLGFAVASAIPGNAGTSFGIAFCIAISGILLLNYGNISDFRGAMAAGLIEDDHAADDEDEGFDSSTKKEKGQEETLPLAK